MLTYGMDARGNFGKYEHLYRCVRADIERGANAAGERLPSKRSLAAHLGVSAITVEQAYAQLAAEGYLHAREAVYAVEDPGYPVLASICRAHGPAWRTSRSRAFAPARDVVAICPVEERLHLGKRLDVAPVLDALRPERGDGAREHDADGEEVQRRVAGARGIGRHARCSEALL